MLENYCLAIHYNATLNLRAHKTWGDMKKGGEEQSRDFQDSSDRENNSIIIDHLYQVATDPERLESLLDIWDQKIAPFKGIENIADSKGETGFRNPEIENHASRASDVLGKLDDGSKLSVFRSLVDSIMPSTAFVTTSNGTVITANSAAKSIFKIFENENLSDLAIEQNIVDELKVTAALLGKKSEGENSSLLRLQSTEKDRILVFKLMALDTNYDDQTCILYVSTEIEWPKTLSITIVEAFGLTQSEVDIIKGLVEGSNLKQIADKRGRSLATVKTQLRSILSKTETHTQAELIRVTLGLMDVVAATQKNSHIETNSVSSAKLVDRQFITLERPNERQADHIVIGSMTGKPIFYLPLDYGLIRMPATAEKFAEDNNLMIIVPIRPGYGNTTSVKKRDDTTTAVIDDMIAIMDHYNIKNAPFIALSNDAFYLYHLYDRHPDRITAILNCGVGLPTFKAEQYERMDKWHRFILANAKYAPAILPFFVKAGFSLARRIGKKGFVNTVYGDSPADKETFANEEVYEAMIVGSEICLSETHSAHEAFSNEVIIQQQDWSESVKKCNLPIHIWYGHQDPQVPLETVREMQEAYPHIEYIADPDAGQLIFFKNWNEIIKKAMTYL